MRKFAQVADYLVVNISSPNTQGLLRDLQGKKALDELVTAVMATRDDVCSDGGETSSRKVPLLVKIAPDLTDQDKKDIADVFLKRKVDGLIISNTTVSRPKSLRSYHKVEAGGLSRAPVRDLSTRVIGDIKVIPLDTRYYL